MKRVQHLIKKKISLNGINLKMIQNKNCKLIKSMPPKLKQIKLIQTIHKKKIPMMRNLLEEILKMKLQMYNQFSIIILNKINLINKF